ncbi:MAG: Uma2 family endonuclease [Acidobacteria bacterium]|nr:Uma2 family endonuclease [Acidobacteriota bacterium]
MNEPAVNLSAKKVSSEDFMRSERQASRRNELFDGAIMPKAAANRQHNLLATNIAIAVGSRVQGGKTEIYVNGMMVQLGPKTICYPDVVMTNGEPKFADENSTVLKNPITVVEIVSAATNPYEKSRKLESYLAIPSIKECLLIRADEMRVELYARQNAKQWLYRIFDERDSVVSLDSINTKISVSEIYAGLSVKPAEMSSTAVN